MALVEVRPTWKNQIMSPDDLVEGERYEAVHSHLPGDPRQIRICVIGKRKAAISNKDSLYPDDIFHYADFGLIPYESGKWNESNYIRSFTDNFWFDDWM